jgi:hypothetical protein
LLSNAQSNGLQWGKKNSISLIVRLLVGLDFKILSLGD